MQQPATHADGRPAHCYPVDANTATGSGAIGKVATMPLPMSMIITHAARLSLRVRRAFRAAGVSAPQRTNVHATPECADKPGFRLESLPSR